MNIDLIPVPIQLKHDVECIRIVHHNHNSKSAIHVCLNGLPGLVFEHHEGQSPLDSIITPRGQSAHEHTLFVYGQMTEPSLMNYQNELFTTIQFVLKPHALSTLFAINASEMTNALVELTEFSTNNLNDQMLNTNNLNQQMNLLIDFLSNKVKYLRSRDTLVEESLRFIHTKIKTITVRELLEHLNISERQFERRFHQTVGVSPKFYIRVKRFNAAIELLKNGSHETLTDVAHELNFYDQSHFIRDIKAFSGITPRKLSQKVDDFRSENRVISFS